MLDRFSQEQKKKLAILSTDGMSPMGVELQEPVWTCLPFVMVLPTQKLIKLFLGNVNSRGLSTKRQQSLRANERVSLTNRLSLAIDLLDDRRIQC